MNKPFKYHKEQYTGMLCYTCDTDFSKYDYKPSLTIYKKGWFRDHENEFVLMITDIMKPLEFRHNYAYFKTQKEINAYIKPLLKGFSSY